VKTRSCLGALLVLLVPAGRASATYSIVASDSASRQAGGSGTSCLRGADVYIIYGSAPGRGVVHAQALANQAGRDRAVQLLEQGMSPTEILAAITGPGFDSNAASRQYGVVDVTGRSAGFTGTSAQAFADDRQGQVGTFSYSVQGNILTSEAVLTQAATAFASSTACDLADRLMLALEAGARNGEGDSRCTESLGIPSDSAFIQVEAPAGPRGSFLTLRVRASGRDHPITLLRTEFDEWRAANPCAPPSGGAGAGSGGSSAGSAGTAGAAGANNGGSPAAGASSGGSSAAGASSGGSAAGASSAGTSGSGGTTSPGGSGGAPAPAEGGDESSGCGCSLQRDEGRLFASAAFAAGLAALLRLRRRARPR